MIDIAACATNGVMIFNQKATQEEIMNMFKNQLTWLNEWLNLTFCSKTKRAFQSCATEKAAEKAKLVTRKVGQVIEHTRQLIIDMPVWWSSTYGMLHWADQLKGVSRHIPADT